ncbi:MAG: hypothetical protein AAB681_03455, partial [Patescibacteria group bacterium]
MQKTNYITWVLVVVIVAVALYFVFKNKKPIAPTITEAPVTQNEPTQDSSDVSGAGAVSISYA